MRETVREFVSDNYEDTLKLLKRLAAIPAPSGREGERAAFILQFLMEEGAGDCWIDETGNVIVRMPENDEEEKNFSVFAAHMDIVFPDTRPLTVYEDDTSLSAPGIGDDTANLVNLLMTVRFFLRHRELIRPHGLMFVANTGEEGDGNLAGTKGLFRSFGSRIRDFTSLDLYLGTLVEEAVGSSRYRIHLHTAGGHSLHDFGRMSALKAAADLVERFYGMQLPPEGLATYNVGTLYGGTSINAIASDAELTYEFRYDRESVRDYMTRQLEEALRSVEHGDVRVNCTGTGFRPCTTDRITPGMREFRSAAERTVGSVLKKNVQPVAASTDANIPLSMGIPAVAFGTVSGAGLHTRDEWIDKASLMTGQELAIRFALDRSGVI